MNKQCHIIINAEKLHRLIEASQDVVHDLRMNNQHIKDGRISRIIDTMVRCVDIMEIIYYLENKDNN